MSKWMFIHGAASNHHTWARQRRLGWDVWMEDLPTLDHSSPRYLIDHLADWCSNQLTEPAIIVGHSMGGAIAQIMALKHPKKVLALVLVGTGPHLPVNSQLLDLLANNPTEALEKIARWSISKNSDPKLLEVSIDMAKTVPKDRALQEFTACQFFDARPQLHQILCPVFLIRAIDDKMTPTALSDEFLSVWPNMPVFDIADAGHLMMLEQPEKFNKILDSVRITIQEKGV
ncbi:MAG: alpha/beta hydrolase [Firmicutes bacterium]|nr:alpha/beta hydrolase [Bacillota bacterium]